MVNKDFIAGCIGGTVGVTMSYPIDTLKTMRQTRTPVNLRYVYSGFSSPLIGMMAEKSVLFFGYNQFKERYNLPTFGSGLLAGVLTTLIVTPVERVKIRSQVTKTPALRTLVNTIRIDGAASLYRGWSATLFREVPGFGVYFCSYDLYKTHLDRINPSHSIINIGAAGGLAGSTAWTMIYPSDPVKTLAQNKNIATSEAFKRIWSTDGVRGFYRGYTSAIVRAAVLHCGVFLGYERSKELLR